MYVYVLQIVVILFILWNMLKYATFNYFNHIKLELYITICFGYFGKYSFLFKLLLNMLSFFLQPRYTNNTDLLVFFIDFIDFVLFKFWFCSGCYRFLRRKNRKLNNFEERLKRKVGEKEKNIDIKIEVYKLAVSRWLQKYFMPKLKIDSYFAGFDRLSLHISWALKKVAQLLKN